jgi:hypothetical protein
MNQQANYSFKLPTEFLVSFHKVRKNLIHQSLQGAIKDDLIPWHGTQANTAQRTFFGLCSLQELVQAHLAEAVQTVRYSLGVPEIAATQFATQILVELLDGEREAVGVGTMTALQGG